MKSKARLIFFFIGIVGMIVMFVTLAPENIPWEDLFSVQTIYLFLGLFALWFVIYVVHTLSYYVILGREGKKIPFFSMFKICITGFALNSVTPAGLVGGEPYRIMEMRRYCSTEKASSSTLTFSLFYVMGHVVAWLTTVLIYCLLGFPGETYISIILIIAGVVCLGGTVLFFRSKRKGFVYPFMRFLAKLPFLQKPMTKLIDKKATQFAEIDNNIRDFRTKKRFWIVLGLQFFSRIIESIEYFIIFIYFGAEINLIEGFLIFGVASLIGNIIFIIPMQAGSREGGLFIALSMIGVIEAIGSAASMVYRLRDFLCISFGIMLLLITKKTSKEKALAQTVGMETLSPVDNQTGENAPNKNTYSENN